MNEPHQPIVQFRCQYFGCESKVFHQIDSRGLFRDISGNVIWDLKSHISIVYYPTCAYHALDWQDNILQNCQRQ